MAVQLSTGSITTYNGWFGCTITQTTSGGYTLTRPNIWHDKNAYVSAVLRPAFNRAFWVEDNIPSFTSVLAKSEIFYLKGTIPSVSCVFRCIPYYAPGTFCKHNGKLTIVLSTQGPKLVCGYVHTIMAMPRDASGGFFTRNQIFVCDRAACSVVQEFYDIHMHYYVQETRTGRPVWPLRNPYGVNARRLWPYQLVKGLSTSSLRPFMSETLLDKIQEALPLIGTNGANVIKQVLKDRGIFTKFIGDDIAFMEETGISIVGGEPKHESCLPIDEQSFQKVGLQAYQLLDTRTYPIIVSEQVLAFIIKGANASFTRHYLNSEERRFKIRTGRTPVRVYNHNISAALSKETVPPKMGALQKRAAAPKRGSMLTDINPNLVKIRTLKSLKRLRTENGPVDFTNPEI